MRVLLLHLLCVSSSSRASVRGRQLYVEGARFTVRGVCYSPVPINGSVYFEPYGDYFTAEFSFIWRRDLPLIKAMGANMVRVYGWSKTADHTAFLDAAHANGLKVMATFYMVRRALATRAPGRTGADGHIAALVRASFPSMVPPMLLFGPRLISHA